MVKQQELRVNTKTPVKRKMTARSYEYLHIISVIVVTMILLSLNSFNSNPESTTERKKRLWVCSVFLIKMGQGASTFVGVYRKHSCPNRD